MGLRVFLGVLVVALVACASDSKSSCSNDNKSEYCQNLRRGIANPDTPNSRKPQPPPTSVQQFDKRGQLIESNPHYKPHVP